MIPSIAFIGAGRVASALSRAFVHAGVAVATIASRNPVSAQKLSSLVAGSRAAPLRGGLAEDLVFLTVPDDDIVAVCASLSWRAGQCVVHCSGATEVAALSSAADAGAATGGFHPLQTFSDPDRAIGLLAGTTVAVEGPPALDATLREIAIRLGMLPLTLPAGARAAYHGGASFAASFVGSMIEEAVVLWGSFGIAEQDALRALLPLAHGNLATIATRGITGAVSGPISRGDVGVVRRHLVAFDGLGEEHGRLYREFATRQLRLALAGGRIDAVQAARLAEAIRESDQ